MFKEEEIQINRILGEHIANYTITADSIVYLFGVNDYLRAIVPFLRERAITVKNILDNDAKKMNTYSQGIEVINPCDIPDEDKEEAVFLVCSSYWREMKRQLEGIGVSGSRIAVFPLKTYERSLFDSVKSAVKGRSIYRRIVRSNPGKKVLLCPYTGTGDIYLIGTFLDEYLEKEKISDFVLVVVSVACLKVAKIFQYENIYRINGLLECRDLCTYFRACPDECDLTILNDSWADMYTNPVGWFRGLHGMNFTEMFRIFVFDLDRTAKPKHPSFINVTERIEEIMKPLDLLPGKTVIVSPYSTTLSDMPMWVWENIVKKLVNKGFKVCTNVGNDSEKAIEGTVPLFFPLDIAPQLVSYAGFFVGVRSGLCDVISGANAKKIILYDKDSFFVNCSAYDYFSLNLMGLSEDAIEIQYDHRSLSDVCDKVLASFT